MSQFKKKSKNRKISFFKSQKLFQKMIDKAYLLRSKLINTVDEFQIAFVKENPFSTSFKDKKNKRNLCSYSNITIKVEKKKDY